MSPSVWVRPEPLASTKVHSSSVDETAAAFESSRALSSGEASGDDSGSGEAGCGADTMSGGLGVPSVGSGEFECSRCGASAENEFRREELAGPSAGESLRGVDGATTSADGGATG